MGSVNKVILVGNLGRDAELRYTPGGAPVATLNLATTEVWNDKARAEAGKDRVAPHRPLGQVGRVAVRIPREGQADLRRRPAADAQVGRQGRQQAYTTEIRGDRIVLLGGGGGGGMGAGRGGGRVRAGAGAGGADTRADGGADQRADRRRHSVLRPRIAEYT